MYVCMRIQLGQSPPAIAAQLCIYLACMYLLSDRPGPLILNFIYIYIVTYSAIFFDR